MLCKGCTPRRKRICAYCGQQRAVAAVWADGPACSSCYRQFMRAKNTCPGCGQHRRLLPYLGHSQPTCATCAGAPPGPVCEQCGNEDWLYHKNRCARCVLTRQLADVLGDAEHRARLGLQPLFDTLVLAQRPESIIGWMRPSSPGTAHVLLAKLGRGEVTLSHEALDALNSPGNGGTANHLDAILTAVGALPPRDLELARLERAIAVALDAVANADHRKTLRSYATWDLLRRARAASRTQSLTPAFRHNASAKLATASHLLDWLAALGTDLSNCRNRTWTPDLSSARAAETRSTASWPGRAAPAVCTNSPSHRDAKVCPGSHQPTTTNAGRWPCCARCTTRGTRLPTGSPDCSCCSSATPPPPRHQPTDQRQPWRPRGSGNGHSGTSPIDLPEPLGGHVKDLLATRRGRTGKHVTESGSWAVPQSASRSASLARNHHAPAATHRYSTRRPSRQRVVDRGRRATARCVVRPARARLHRGAGLVHSCRTCLVQLRRRPRPR